MWRIAYDRWLMPDQPGLRQLLIVLVLWLLPLLCLRTSDGTDPHLLVWSVGLGAGLGLAWALTTGGRWLGRAPISTVVVFLCCLGAAANLVLMPRWDALLRALHAEEALILYLEQSDPAHQVPPPYATGQGAGLAELITDAHQAVLGAYTRDPILRWTPWGFRPACYVVVRASGQPTVVRNAADLATLLATIRPVPSPALVP